MGKREGYETGSADETEGRKVKNREESRNWREIVASLQRLVRDEGDLGRRMKILADALLGRPYVTSPLIGGPDEPERVVIDLCGFDCVTFVETVLSLARSRTRLGFAAELVSTRYRGGEVSYAKRLHYFSDWMKQNERRGAIRIRTRGAGARSLPVTLDLLAAFPPRRVSLTVVPRRSLALAADRIGAGAIAAFATVRARLDFFHSGLLFPGTPARRPEDSLVLYHAARSRGGVVAEPLGEFLRRNRMRGIAFATPQDTGETT